MSPSHGVEPCAAVPRDLDADREDALGLDADVQVGRLAGDREVRPQALLDERLGAAVLDVLGLLVGHADEAHPHAPVAGDVVDRAHHRREAALHVVRAAADEPVAFDARLELAGVRRDDVDVPVEDHGRAVGGADLGKHHRQAAELAPRDGDVASFEPPLHEAHSGAQAIVGGRVVGHQALGQNPFVHPRKGTFRVAGKAADGGSVLREVSARIVLFGATGFTGELTARALAAHGAQPLLVGRNAERVRALAAELGLESATADATAPDASARIAALLQPRRRPGLDRRAVRALGRARGAGRDRRPRALPGLDGRGPVHPGGLRALRAARAGRRQRAADGDGLRLRARQPRGRAGAARGGPGRDARRRRLLRQRRPRRPVQRRHAGLGRRHDRRAGATRIRDGRIVSERTAKALRDVRAGPARGRRSRSARASSSRCRACIPACATWASGSAGSARRRGSCRRCRRRRRSRRSCPACAARSPRRRIRLVHGSTGGPDAATRARARSRVVAIASDAAGATLATVRVEGASPYDFTADMLAVAAIRAADGGLRGAGALGPVDGFGLDELERDVAAAGIARTV